MFRSKRLLCSCGLAPASDAHHTCRFRGPPVFVRNSVDTRCQENCRPQVWFRWRVTLLSKNKPQSSSYAARLPEKDIQETDMPCALSLTLGLCTVCTCQFRGPAADIHLRRNNDTGDPHWDCRCGFSDILCSAADNHSRVGRRISRRQNDFGLLLFCVSLAPACDLHHACRFRGAPISVRT